MKDLLLGIALSRPRTVLVVTALLTIGFALMMPRIQVDTDPENMLPADEPSRVHHEEVKEAFGLHDYLVVGIVREAEGGVFRPETLARVNQLTDGILDLDGVIADDVVAPSQVDDVFTEDGVLRVATLMEEAPTTLEGSRKILERIRANPFLRGRLASDDGRALALFIPLESKDRAHDVAGEVEALIAELGGDEEYHLAGIPLAEDQFGSQMFLQMAYGGPAAFVLIFLLMLLFFRNVRLVIGPMLLAMMTVIWTMGLLIGLGFTVHIMSSMIPVFLIPIAVLDSIHLLSEFHERYPKSHDRKQALRETVNELFAPMTYTSVTTIVGFASLMLTPIPPVQVFGGAVSFGIAMAWLLSMTFLMAYASLVPVKSLENFGHTADGGQFLVRVVAWTEKLAVKRARLVLGFGLVIFAVSVAGLTRIVVNDNPVKWFRPGHPVRVADDTMNRHLAGTYLAYVALQADEPDAFKDPDTMRWLEGLQRHLETDSNVGGTTSIADVVKKVRAELLGSEAEGMIPDTSDEIAQEIFLYEISGGDPEDLFKLISSDTDHANVWIQMHRGENRDVAHVIRMADEYLKTAPPGIHPTWAGLPYINIVWQSKMVSGMGKALAGSAITVFLMMVWLFRSFRLGLLSMVPLTATIVLVYGLIGWVGKAYDMPIAVLSSLTLGLSIDFAIHFLQRAREAFDRTGNIRETLDDVFGPPARAIVRNVIVIALGFVPMFFASLVPYVTVSLFFFAIMMISGFTTMISLPSILLLTGGGFLRSGGKTMKASTAATTALLGGMLLLGGADRAAAAPDAATLMKESHLAMYYAGEDGTATVSMELVDKRGKTRERRFVMLRRDEQEGGAQKYFTYFFEPSDVRRTTFMVWKDPDADDARWIYVPAVDLVKRISAKDKGSSFVGSDFSYEDVSGRKWTEDNHTYLDEVELDGRMADRIESRPKSDSDETFLRKVTWVDRETKLPLKEEYYDRKDELERVFLAEKIETIDGHATATVRSMENVRKEHHTTVTFDDVRFDTGVDPDLFTERKLKNPPAEAMGGR